MLTSYDRLVLADRPVLYLPLDDSAGSTATALVGSNGTYNGSPTLNRTGPRAGGLDTAVLFDASTEYVIPPASVLSLNTDFTMEMWVKISDLSTRPLASCDAASNNYWIWLQRSDASDWCVQYDVGGGSNHIDSNVDLALDTWQHAVVSRGGNDWTFVINGVHQATVTNSVSTLTTTNPKIAAYSSFTINGDAAGFAFYNYTLSAAQIARHYQATPHLPRTLTPRNRRL